MTSQDVSQKLSLSMLDRTHAGLASSSSTVTTKEIGRTKDTKVAQLSSNAVAVRNFDREIMLLQNGGALGAYRAEVYEGVAEAGQTLTWVVGVSIDEFAELREAMNRLLAKLPPGLKADHDAEHFASAWEESAALPVLEVLSAPHILSDLTLDLGSVVFDYLATR